MVAIRELGMELVLMQRLHTGEPVRFDLYLSLVWPKDDLKMK